MRMKLSRAQLSVLQHLAACDEPLAYFKGGFWTLPSLILHLADERPCPWHAAVGTVRKLEQLGLLVQTGTSTNYDIRFYPALSDRVLTEKGLTTAKLTALP